MWKIVWVLVIFNTNTKQIENTRLSELKKGTPDKYFVDIAEGLIGGKSNNLKFIKVIKDSVYIPHDSCYDKPDKYALGGTFRFLKQHKP